MRGTRISCYAPFALALFAGASAVIFLSFGACSISGGDARPRPAAPRSLPPSPSPAFRATSPQTPAKPHEAEDSTDSPSRWRQKLRAKYASLELPAGVLEIDAACLPTRAP